MSADLTPESLDEIERLAREASGRVYDSSRSDAWSASAFPCSLSPNAVLSLVAGYREREALRAERDRLASIVERAKGVGADLIDALSGAVGIMVRDEERCPEASPRLHDGNGERLDAARSALEVALAEREALTFDRLRAANVERCNASFGRHMEEWTPNDWATALAGEVGELCNELKKLRRGDDSTPEALASRHEAIRHEAADVACYLDLLCARMGIDLGAAVREKFNAVSVRRGSPVRL